MKKTHIIGIGIVSIALLGVLCSMIGPEQPVVTGAVAPHVEFASSKATDVSFDPLIKTHIKNVKLRVVHGGGTTEETFDFNSGSGRVEGILPGEVTVEVMARDVHNVTIMSGFVNVRVRAGETARPTIAARPDREDAPYLSPVIVGSDNSVRLEWYMWEVDGSQQNYTQFRIQKSDNSGSNWADFQTVGYNEGSWTDGGTSVGQTYYYRIVADGSNGPSQPSNIVNVTIPGSSGSTGSDLNIYSVVDNGGHADGDHVTIFWTFNGDENGIIGFDVMRSVGATWNKINPSLLNKGTDRYYDHDYQSETLVRYQVFARSQAGDMSSNEVSIDVGGTSGGAGVFLKTPMVDASGVHLNWTIDAGTLANTDWFRVERYNPTVNQWDILNDNISTGTSGYTDTNPIPNSTRKYRVCAIQSGGGAVCSNEQHVSVPN